MISRKELNQWKKSRDFRLMKLSMEDYYKAFDFAVKQFYLGGPALIEWGKTKRRDIGEFLTNQIMGKLGELALSKFLFDGFNVEIGLSFKVEKEVPGQDVTRVVQIEEGRKIPRSPKIKVSIKTTKMQNFNLWVIKESIDDSDAYVLCRADLPLDHTLRIVRDHEKFSAIKDRIPELNEIETEVVGFSWRDELKARGASMEMRGADGRVVQELRRPQYVMLSGELRKSKEDWQSLIDAL